MVAIDGPAGAGKSSVTERLAHRLGYARVDTGAMYRAVAFAAMEAGLALDDGDAVGYFAQELVQRGQLDFEARPGGPTGVKYDGRDITAEVRTPEVSLAASAVARLPEVRTALLLVQRAAGAKGGVVLEGRDIGTVVFPNADLKFFLTASEEVRASRRFDELRAKGMEVSLADTLHEVRVRDANDASRDVSPLRQADDAVLVDSSASSQDEVVDTMFEMVRAKELAV